MIFYLSDKVILFRYCLKKSLRDSHHYFEQLEESKTYDDEHPVTEQHFLVLVEDVVLVDVEEVVMEASLAVEQQSPALVLVEDVVVLLGIDVSEAVMEKAALVLAKDVAVALEEAMEMAQISAYDRYFCSN